MTRYFVNYIDVDEVQELRKTQHERPIGKYEDGEEITVSWRVVGVEVTVAPVVVIDA